MFITAIIFTLIGTFAVRGTLTVHWNDAGTANSSAGKWFLWTIADIVSVVYDLHPSIVIPVIGTAAIVSCYILFAVAAYIRDRKI